MCVFVSRPMKIVTFLRKNGDSAKRVVDFPRERDTFRNKIMEIVEDFACEANFLHFFNCSSFFVICSFFFFSIFHFSFSSFFHFFLFFLFWVARNPFFLASIAARFLGTFLPVKKMFEPSRKVPLWALFSFFSLVSFFYQKNMLFNLLYFFFFLHFF